MSNEGGVLTEERRPFTFNALRFPSPVSNQPSAVRRPTNEIADLIEKRSESRLFGSKNFVPFMLVVRKGQKLRVMWSVVVAKQRTLFVAILIAVDLFHRASSP